MSAYPHPLTYRFRRVFRLGLQDKNCNKDQPAWLVNKNKRSRFQNVLEPGTFYSVNQNAETVLRFLISGSRRIHTHNQASGNDGTPRRWRSHSHRGRHNDALRNPARLRISSCHRNSHVLWRNGRDMRRLIAHKGNLRNRTRRHMQTAQ